MRVEAGGEMMAEKKKEKKRRRWWLTALFLLLLLPPSLLGGWLLYTVGQEQLIDPLVARLWAIYLVWEQIPQELLWGILFVIGCISLLRLFITPPDWAGTLPALTPLMGQVSRWASLLNAAGQPSFTGKKLAVELRKLVINHWANQTHVPPEKAEEMLRAGQLPLSPTAVHFLQPSRTFTSTQNPSTPETLHIINEITTQLEEGGRSER